MKTSKDKIELVTAISGILAKENVNIVSMREHVDNFNNRFFARIEVEQCADTRTLEEKLYDVLPADVTVKVNPSPEKKIIVLATKEHHCLADILIRNQFKTLGASVQCVIANHTTLYNLCERFEVPFYHVSHEQKDRAAFEADMLDIISRHDVDYLVLAKFMRILSPQFIERFPMRIINIHHSFLPAFIGANPYRQAFERGVKLMGATAHFVTNELDEGPIIVQQIAPVNHSFTLANMINTVK
jgi:formyltetrahydrofolate deformylase